MTSLFSDLPLPGMEPGVRADDAESALPRVVAPRETDSDDASDGTGPLVAQALLDGLNPPQRQAVTHAGGQLLIIAGAGSGKTRVLTHRIAYLLATGRSRPGQILAITFTNKAAAEMRERVEDLVGPRARHMWVSTFHSACVRILRREAKTIGLRSGFSIYDAADSQRLMTLVCKELDLDPKRFPPKAFSHRVSDLKNELVDPDAFAATAGENPQEQNLAAAYKRYQQRLVQAHALDFDDLIMTTVHMLQAFPEVAQQYRRRFRHVLVDEYQDTNHAQYVLVRELVGMRPDGGSATEGVEPAQLTVVGDADQSIYAFRGATIRNIIEFETDYPDAATILLEQNYRSTQTILSAANAVIARNPGRKRKNLWTDSGDGPQIVGYVADNEHEEARFIATEVARLGTSDGIKPADVAIFYRTNAQSRALEEVLVRAGLPYKVVGGTRFYERREIKDAIAYLRAIVNPDDAVSVRRILNVPKRGLGDRSEAMIAAHAEREQISFGAAITAAEDIVGLATRAVTTIKEFDGMLRQLRAAAQDGASPAELLDSVLEESGYLRGLRASDDPQDATRVENLAELHAVAVEFAESDPDGDLGDFLERVALVADADQIPEGEQGVITLMTVHTAKGLEFPAVFVTGLEDGTFPHQRSLADPDELAEERRLAYVALTRARNRLYVSRASVRTAFGIPNEFPESRFIADVPDDLIDWKRRESSMQRYRSGSYAGARGGTGPRSARVLQRRDQRRVQPAADGPKFGSATPRADVPDLAVGDRVTHDAYGMGKVVAIESSGANAVAKIDFGQAGAKRLLLRYSPVTKL
ncbi:MAG: DNA helicase PcrA [Beutenbergiaceae bacterium]